MNSKLKSSGAVVAGLAFIVITHTATDTILEAVGVLPRGHLNVGPGLIFLVIFYRAFFSLLGCCIAAMLAPQRPMEHALFLGFVGVVFGSIGAIVTSGMNIGPSWYGWALVGVAMPMAWLGGRLYLVVSKPKGQ